MKDLKKSLLSLGFFGLALPVFGSIISVSALHDWHFDHHFIHAILESCGAIAAFLLFLLFYLNKKLHNQFEKNEIISISSAIIGMGVLDGFHALSPVGNNFVWLHSIATFMGGVLFAGVWLPKSRLTSAKRIPLFVFISSVIIGILSFATPQNVPVMLVSGEFTLLARLLNIIGGVGFIFATVYFFKKFSLNKDNDFYLLSAHCLLFGAAGILFELSSLWDAAWWWWHILRLAAYLILIFFFAETIVKQSEKIFINFSILDIQRFLLGVITFTAAIIILGWHTGNTGFIEANHTSSPMHYNNALGFLLSGIGIFSLGIKHFKISKICALIIILLGVITLIEYLADIDIGIDQMFIKDYVENKVTHPGRMAPIAALCFTVTGLAILFYQRKIALLSFAFSLLLFSSITLIAHRIADDSTHGIASLTQMPLNTTIGFLLLSVVFILKSTKERRASFDIWAASPAICSIVLMLLTIMAWQIAREFTIQTNKSYFNTLVNEKIDVIEKRFSLYRQALLGGVGLINASNEVSREEWKKYVEAINPEINLPGTNGLGYIDYVEEDNLSEYLIKSKADGFPNFVNKPKTEFSDKYIIKYIEPVDINLPAVGLDVGFERNRREGVMRARDTGKTSLTKIIFLVQDNEKRAGFLLLTPVYEKGKSISTVEERRKSFIGMVYSPFMGRKFMADINKISNVSMNFEVYDGEEIDEDNIIYKEEDHDDLVAMSYLTHTTQTNFAGQIWTIIWRPNTSFAPKIDANTPEIILIIGIIVSIIFSFLFYLLSKIYGDSAKTLEENRKRLSNIIENAVDGLIVMSNTGIVELYNPACEKIFGYKASEVIGNNVKMLMPESYSKKHDRNLANYLITKKKHIIGKGRELEAQHKNGSIFPIELSVSEVDLETHKIFSGIVRDISERKYAEEEIKKTQKELESFIYIASHDLRSPLINLKGFTVKLTQHVNKLASYLEAHMNKLTNDEQADIKEIIEEKIPKASRFVQEGVSRIDNMTTAILNLSRTGRRDLTFAKIDMTDLLLSCRNVLGHQLKEKNAKIQIENVPNIIGDSTALEQIFGNLLDNAIKYLEPKRNGVIRVSCTNAHSHYQFEIEDNGRGIAEDDKDKVFAIFRRAGNVISDTQGEGMGLNHTKALVERHGGKIWFKSKLGEGTTFFFTIDKNLKPTKESKNDQ